jgi:hypothetical protein
MVKYGCRQCECCGRMERTIVVVSSDMTEITCDRCGSLTSHPTVVNGIQLYDYDVESKTRQRNDNSDKPMNRLEQGQRGNRMVHRP